MGERVVDGYVMKRFTRELDPMEFTLPLDMTNIADVNVVDVKYAICGEKLTVFATMELMERVEPDKGMDKLPGLPGFTLGDVCAMVNVDVDKVVSIIQKLDATEIQNLKARVAEIRKLTADFTKNSQEGTAGVAGN